MKEIVCYRHHYLLELQMNSTLGTEANILVNWAMFGLGVYEIVETSFSPA